MLEQTRTKIDAVVSDWLNGAVVKPTASSWSNIPHVLENGTKAMLATYLRWYNYSGVKRFTVSSISAATYDGGPVRHEGYLDEVLNIGARYNPDELEIENCLVPALIAKYLRLGWHIHETPYDPKTLTRMVCESAAGRDDLQVCATLRIDTAQYIAARSDVLTPDLATLCHAVSTRPSDVVNAVQAACSGIPSAQVLELARVLLQVASQKG